MACIILLTPCQGSGLAGKDHQVFEHHHSALYPAFARPKEHHDNIVLSMAPTIDCSPGICD